MGSLNILYEVKPILCPKFGMSEFAKYGKSTEKYKYPKVMGFLNILGEREIHTISKLWDEDGFPF